MLLKLIHSFRNRGSVLKDTFLYSFVVMGNKIVPFILVPIYTSKLSLDGYGEFSMFNILTVFLVPLISINLYSAAMRRYYDLTSDELSSYVFSCISVHLSSGVFIFAIFFLFSHFFSDLFKVSVITLLIAVVASFFFSLSNYFLTLTRAAKRKKEFLVFSIAQSVILILTQLLILKIKVSLLLLLCGYTVVYFLFSSISVIWLLRNGFIKFTFNKAAIKDALAYSLPTIVSNFAASIFVFSDRIILANFLGLGIVAVFSAIYQVCSVIGLFTSSLSMSWSPYLFESLTVGTDKVKRSVVKNVYVISGIIGSIGLAVYWILPYFIKLYLHNPLYYQGIQYIPWFVAGFALQGVYFIFSGFIFYSGKNIYLTAGTLGAALLNIGLNFCLIRKIGPIGAVFASTSSWFFLTVFCIVVSNKLIKMPWKLL